MIEANRPLVSVCMITYNHQDYIEEAIEGVLMQICDFDYELIIVDDNSTDQTDLIINRILKSYSGNSKINYIRNTSNKGMIKNFLGSLSLGTGKYIAICEGDDFWIDPLKLQSQVEILDNNLTYGMIYTSSKRYYQEFGKFVDPLKNRSNSNFFLDFETLLFKNPIRTCTTLVRNSLIKEYLENYSKVALDWKMGDAPLWLFVSLNNKIFYQNKNTAVYRILENSATNVSPYKKLLFRFSRYNVSWFFLKRNFSLSLGIKLLINFIKEVPILVLKSMLSALNLYKPNKQKVINKHL